MSSSNLAPHLLRAAQLFSTVFKTCDKKIILVGGAASVIQGLCRATRDLDFDLAERPTPNVIKQLAKVGITLQQTPGTKHRFSANVPESSPGARDAVSIDIAVKSKISHVVKNYSQELLGITVARPDYLLTTKLRAVADRPFGTQKLISDMTDVLFLCEELEATDAVVPPELKETMTPQFQRSFWDRVNEIGHWDHKTLAEIQYMLQRVGFDSGSEDAP